MLERRTYERRRHSTAVVQVHSLNKHRNMYIDHISVQSSIAFGIYTCMHDTYCFFWELTAQDLSAHICPHLGQQSGATQTLCQWPA